MGLQRRSAVTCRFGQGAHKLGENKTAIIVSCGFISNGRLLVCAVLFWQQKKSCSSSAQELHLAQRAYMCDYVRGRRWSSSLGRYYAGIWGGYLNDLHRWQHCCCQHGGNVIKRKAFFFLYELGLYKGAEQRYLGRRYVFWFVFARTNDTWCSDDGESFRLRQIGKFERLVKKV